MTTNGKKAEKRVEPNIKVRSDGFAYQVRLKLHGVRINETFRTLAEARAFRDRKKADAALDPTAALVLASRQTKRDAAITLADLLIKYQQEITPAKKGARAENLRINKLLRFPIAKLPIRLVNRDAVIQFMRTPSETWSENTLRKYLMIISSLFSTAVKKWGMTLENPIKQVQLPSNGPSRKRRLEDREYLYLAESLSKCRSKYMRPLLDLAIETAARRGELLRLLWEDVDLVGRTALLRDTKNGEDRIIPLSKNAISILSSLDRPSCGRVLPLQPEQVRVAFDYAKKRALSQYIADCTKSGEARDPKFLLDLRFHDSRHEATSRLFEKGLDAMEAASVTGHKTLAMLKNYTHLHAQRLADKLD